MSGKIILLNSKTLCMSNSEYSNLSLEEKEKICVIGSYSGGAIPFEKYHDYVKKHGSPTETVTTISSSGNETTTKSTAFGNGFFFSSTVTTNNTPQQCVSQVDINKQIIEKYNSVLKMCDNLKSQLESQIKSNTEGIEMTDALLNMPTELLEKNFMTTEKINELNAQKKQFEKNLLKAKTDLAKQEVYRNQTLLYLKELE